MRLKSSDKELFDLVRCELFSAVVGDVTDKMGLVHQVLPPQIKPIQSDMVVVGRAMPVLEVDIFSEVIENSANKLMSKPFGLMLYALDDPEPNEVYVCTGASPRYAFGGN